ncbi:PTS lactose/cellobiose transporter subunit IIA [Holdemania massiliensis]|uniref:PTS lactose/cellobiose transporter subunit IIA n=1 Tax=Holdemania massiliensis TaxID=1468449 RepID=UPI001F0658B0|nr:PTS lactose/cellobiose transporter subunit IIA [Holdemania massiliensis]MCH1939726.1 PTS lactose/cellobiose transporter subunit IIA [Holdemania massiliensis]
MNGIELVSFNIISAVGTARSCYIEAIHCAKEEKFEEAENLLAEGQKVFIEGHHAHMELIQKEAEGEKTEFSLLLMHAEDQLMSAEGFGILAEEFISLYKQLKYLKISKEEDNVE